jgi:hypothetical protein
MSAHSLAAPEVCGYKFNREFSWTRAPFARGIREEGLDTVLVGKIIQVVVLIHSNQDIVQTGNHSIVRQLVVPFSSHH